MTAHILASRLTTPSFSTPLEIIWNLAAIAIAVACVVAVWRGTRSQLSALVTGAPFVMLGGYLVPVLNVAIAIYFIRRSPHRTEAHPPRPDPPGD